MDAYFYITTNNQHYSSIICLHDENISSSYINQILEMNHEYFEQIKAGRIQSSTIKFSVINGDVLMRSFNPAGEESIVYFVTENQHLKVYKKVFEDNVIFNRNGLQVFSYDIDENNNMRYQILDNKGLDPLGESLLFEDAISFVHNYDSSFHG